MQAQCLHPSAASSTFCLLGVVASASWFMLLGSGCASGPSAATTAGGGEGGGSMADRGTASVRCGCGCGGGGGDGGFTEIGVASMGGARDERGGGGRAHAGSGWGQEVAWLSFETVARGPPP